VREALRGYLPVSFRGDLGIILHHLPGRVVSLRQPHESSQSRNGLVSPNVDGPGQSLLCGKSALDFPVSDATGNVCLLIPFTGFSAVLRLTIQSLLSLYSRLQSLLPLRALHELLSHSQDSAWVELGSLELRI
jgi:hypothetical protein